jgi:hypothetical protein
LMCWFPGAASDWKLLRAVEADPVLIIRTQIPPL